MVEKTQDELEKAVKEAKRMPGATPREVSVVIREMAKMLQSLKFTNIGEMAVGSYFIPHEGQPNIEGLLPLVAEYMNYYVKAGWQPWQMATPYPGKYAFDLPGGQQTGTLDGQWITILWALPASETQV